VSKTPKKTGTDEGPALPPNPELEAALRDAVESVDEVKKKPAPAPADPAAPGGIPEVLLTEPAEGEFIDEELERLRDDLIEARDKELRLRADFENFRRRALKERQELLQFGHENLVKDILSTVDNLDRAIEHSRQSDGGNLESLLQGVEMLQRELMAVLEQHAVVEIEAKGQMFDPALHEAMSQTPNASIPPNTVIDVLQKGYQLRGRLLRPSRVVVACAPKGDEA
jgi:molecular chaperone GrpE